MCGIAGIHHFHPSGEVPAREETAAALQRLTRAQAHRGPDGEGYYLSADGRVGLGHRRLAIIDLSPAGRQPMGNEDGSIWLTYNGEIYNFQELRAELRRLGHRFRSLSDTEVILHAYEEWGVAAFPRFRGMFAFALWDQRRQTLHLVKDRFGIKPLYYFLDSHRLVFASETRALTASGLFPAEENPQALLGFLLWGALPVPQTTCRQVQALPAGHYLVVHRGKASLRRYFDLWADGHAASRTGAAFDLRSLLAETVQLHLLADAPLGVFLSGGIDSSALVALAAAGQNESLTTLSLNFGEAEFSEAPYQNLVARMYQCRHHSLTLGRGQFLEDLPQALAAQDQPSIDGINIWFVSRLAREAGLKAVISGLGSDEIFCGYPHFRQAGLLTRLFWLGPIFKGLGGHLPALPGRWRKLPFLALHRDLGWYAAIRGLFTPREVARLTGDTLASVQRFADSLTPPAARLPAVDRLSRYEVHFYLQNQLLKDTDCMSMAHGLEVRVPFLDAHLVQAVWSLPAACRMNGQAPKTLLTGALGRLLPPAVVQRPKMTFTLPVDPWLRDWPGWEPLTRGLLNHEAVAAVLLDYRRGRLPWSRAFALLVATRHFG